MLQHGEILKDFPMKMLSELQNQCKLFDDQWTKLSVPKENSTSAENLNDIINQLKTLDHEVVKLITEASNVCAEINNHTGELYRWCVHSICLFGCFLYIS